MDETTQIFLQNGILGAIIVVLGGVVLFLQKKLDVKDQEIKQLNLRATEMIEHYAEKHAEAVQKMTEVVLNNTNALNQLTAKLEARHDRNL
jgi:hypothetical protein